MPIVIYMVKAEDIDISNPASLTVGLPVVRIVGQNFRFEFQIIASVISPYFVSMLFTVYSPFLKNVCLISVVVFPSPSITLFFVLVIISQVIFRCIHFQYLSSYTVLGGWGVATVSGRKSDRIYLSAAMR